jgi:hypothetical protein
MLMMITCMANDSNQATSFSTRELHFLMVTTGRILTPSLSKSTVNYSVTSRVTRLSDVVLFETGRAFSIFVPPDILNTVTYR